jgi:hypothetical protein
MPRTLGLGVIATHVRGTGLISDGGSDSRDSSCYNLLLSCMSV